jgi:hypothetical protein
MGLSATLDECCRKSDFVIQGNKNTRKIVDDILCWGATMQELMSKLDTILMQCKAIGITLSINFFIISKEVAFAGYVVKQGAIRASPERASALKEFPRSQNIHELRYFLGLAQQLASFVPDLAHASELLRHLLKKDKKYGWSPNLQDTFDAVVCDLVLINFDPSRPTILLNDASRLKGLGFALVHTELVNGKERIRLVTCGSRRLNPAKKSYAVVELEALTVKYAVEKCRYYLLGMQKFTVWSDHRVLVGIWRKQIKEIGNARCQKWRENLSAYNFNVEWKEGKTHYVADSLSRAPYWDLPEIEIVFCFSINPTQGIQDIICKAAGKEDFKRILEAVTNGVSVKSITDCHPAAALRLEWDFLSVINGLVNHDCKRIVIPSGARKATLQVLHRPHAGVAKTAEAAKQLYFWPKMNNHIKDMVDACERCQFYKASKQNQEQIQQTPFTDLFPMAEVGADLFEAGKQHFLIVVDRYSGFPLYVPNVHTRAAPGTHRCSALSSLSPPSQGTGIIHPMRSSSSIRRAREEESILASLPFM